MTYYSFRELLKREIETMLPDGECVDLREVIKNNGVRLDGLTIFSRDRCFSPTFYPGHFYRAWQEGTSVHEIASAFVSEYRKFRGTLPEEMVFPKDYLRIQGRLRIRLLNRSMNGELLRNMVRKDYLDLSLVPYLEMPFPDSRTATALIPYARLSEWGVDEEELISDAAATTAMEEGDTLTTLHEELASFGEQAVPDSEDQTLYMLSNRSRIYGAAALVYTDHVRKLSEELSSDLVLLPASIHEWILLANPGTDPEDMNGMVREINRNVLQEGEVLSDHVYFYRRKTQVIEY